MKQKQLKTKSIPRSLAENQVPGQYENIPDPVYETKRDDTLATNPDQVPIDLNRNIAYRNVTLQK